MATALFIKRADLIKNTAMSGSVDTDKFIQFIKIAQEIHVRNYMGTDLYDKISQDIIDGTSLQAEYPIKSHLRIFRSVLRDFCVLCGMLVWLEGRNELKTIEKHTYLNAFFIS